MHSPFRDEREAAFARVAELERENAELRAELAASRRTQTVPSIASRRMGHAPIVFPLLALGALTGMSLLEAESRWPGVAPAQTVVAAPFEGESRWIVLGQRGPVRAGMAVGRTVLFADPAGGIARFGVPGVAGDDRVPRSLDILGLGGGPGGLYAVGAHGTILAEDGARVWQAESAPFDVDLFGVVTSGASAWAVGRGGVVLVRDHGAWRPEASPTTRDLHGIARTPDALYAVGDGGTIVVRKDARGEWLEEPSGVAADLYATFFQGGALYAVGDAGTILRRARDGWVREASGTPYNLRAMGSDGTQIYAVGDVGTILSSRGAGVWRREDAPIGQPLVAIGGTANGVYVASSSGTILRRSPL